jgi:hypothetical protein
VAKDPKYILVRYLFLGTWQVGAPIVVRSGSITPDVLKKYAKHSLPWVFRSLFTARVATSDELPSEYRELKMRTPLKSRAKGKAVSRDSS